ncbi:MAG: hypothetical protein IH984_12140 [Planctomycetes bacterium]|nr:hypothetical protein [Planctomycetota bacterium]
MKTSQATKNKQQRVRLGWLLDTMIEHLNAAPPESALGGIEKYENEAAELIESTGLAEEVGIPDNRLPVFQRIIVEYNTDGLDEFAKLIEKTSGSKVEVTEESFPTCISYKYETTDNVASYSRFDWFAASGLGSERIPDLPPGYKSVVLPPDHPLFPLQQFASKSTSLRDEPDERYIKGLVACLKGWRALNNAPSEHGEVGADDGGVFPDPIENHDLAMRCGYTDLATMSDQIKKALSDAGQALPKVRRGGSLWWSHCQLKKALPMLPLSRLKKFLESTPI